jgi:AraC-like DNA-binding protein
MEKVFNGHVVRSLVQRFEENGIDTAQILERLSIEIQAKFILADQFGNLIEEICEQSGDDRMGLKIGFQSPLSTLGLLGQVYQSCENFGEVLEKMKSNISFLDNVNTYSYEIIQDTIHNITIPNEEWATKFPIASRQIIEHNIGFSLRCKREYLGREIKVIELWSPYKKSADGDLLEEFIKCPIRYEMPYMATVLPLEMLDWSVPTFNPHTLNINEVFLKSEKPDTESWQTKVKTIVINQFENNIPSLQSVAEYCGLSTRTLQRNLKTENATFQQIIDEVRVQMMDFYTTKTNLNNQEISDKLGFEVVNSYLKFRKKSRLIKTQLKS